MYYTGIDPFTKKPVYVAQHLRDRKLQRALMQFFKPENYFDVRKALEQAGRQDLIGSGCDCLIPSNPPREALDKRRADANTRVRGEYVHTIPAAGSPPGQTSSPAKGKGSKKESRNKPGKGYRPGRSSAKD